MNVVVQIPEVWRVGVCRILDRADGGGVLITPSVLDRWRSTFPDIPVTVATLRAMVSAALKDPAIKGVKVTTMKMANGKRDPGEVYEFLFPVDEKKKAYSKVSLRLSNNTVYFYSAHKAERNYL